MKFSRVVVGVRLGAGETQLDVSLSSRDGGNPAEGFTLPYTADHVGQLVGALSHRIPGSGDVRGERGFLPPDEVGGVEPAAVGRRLYECLLPGGDVRGQYDREMAMLYSDVERGVRLQLQLDPRAPHFAELANLPWELMFSPVGSGPLQLDLRVPFSRYIKLSASARRPPFKPPLRILVVMSSPQGIDPLDLDLERRRLEEAFASVDGVELGFLPDPERGSAHATVEAIRDRLVDGRHHVLHFMGHGDFDRSTGEGVLLFETETDQIDRVSGSNLAWRLADIPTLSLVFLNACNTACAPEAGPVGDLAGVAHALMEKGLPAVVAMQFPITDGAAIAFSAKFYGRLAAGLPVDVAVGEGRRAILEAHDKLLRAAGKGKPARTESTLEWATPVLFMRVHDGNLFPRAVSPGETAASEFASQEVPALDAATQARGSALSSGLPSEAGGGQGAAVPPGGSQGGRGGDTPPPGKPDRSYLGLFAGVFVGLLLASLACGGFLCAISQVPLDDDDTTSVDLSPTPSLDDDTTLVDLSPTPSPDGDTDVVDDPPTPEPRTPAPPTPRTSFRSCDDIARFSLCSEYTSVHFEQLSESDTKAMCTESAGRWSSEPCPKSNLVGKCDDGAGFVEFNYSTGGDAYSPGQSRERCESDGDRWTAVGGSRAPAPSSGTKTCRAMQTRGTCTELSERFFSAVDESLARTRCTDEWGGTWGTSPCPGSDVLGRCDSDQFPGWREIYYASDWDTFDAIEDCEQVVGGSW